MIAARGASEDGLMREYKEIRRTSRRKKRNANEVDRSGPARVFDYYHALVADRLSKHRTNIHTPLELISSTNSAPYVAIPFWIPRPNAKPKSKEPNAASARLHHSILPVRSQTARLDRSRKKHTQNGRRAFNKTSRFSKLERNLVW